MAEVSQYCLLKCDPNFHSATSFSGAFGIGPSAVNHSQLRPNVRRLEEVVSETFIDVRQRATRILQAPDVRGHIQNH